MIIEALLAIVLLILQGLGAVLPDVPISFEDELADFADFVGANLGGLNGFLPITETAVAITYALTVYLPFAVAFVTVRWIYAHIPVVGKGN